MKATLKLLMHLLLYKLVSALVFPTKKIQKKNLAIVRIDGIGDYVLFRNFIKTIHESEQYKNYKITLIGNSLWKDLAIELDDEFVNKFIWIERGKFHKNLFYRYKKLKEITLQAYEVVINPVYSRGFFSEDAIIKAIHANEKIGSNGDLSNIKKWQKKISDKYYTKLVPAKDGILFEFYRNREFFKNVLGKNLDIKKPFIKLKEKKISFKLPENYAILFLGASAKFRKWEVRNFVKIGEFLKKKYNYEIVLCGAPSDIEDAKEFKKLAKYDCIDLVGKTSLVDLLYVFHYGSLMVSNETSAPHSAVALEVVNIFVISNGNHYGRFAPYPEEISLYHHPIYHPKIEKDMGDYKKLSNSYGFGSDLDISDITVESVMRKIDSIL